MVYLQSTYPPVEKYGLAGNEKIVKSRKKIVSSQPSLFNSRIMRIVVLMNKLIT